MEHSDDEELCIILNMQVTSCNYNIIQYVYIHTYLALAPEVDDLTGVFSDVKRSMNRVVCRLLNETPSQLTVWLNFEVHPVIEEGQFTVCKIICRKNNIISFQGRAGLGCPVHIQQGLLAYHKHN